MKRSWLARLSRAARWYLPPAEAAEVIGDYTELLDGDGRTEEELLRDMGKPRLAVKQLVERKAYWIWLAVFAVLAACILIPGVSPGIFFWWLWDMCFAGPHTGFLGHDGHLGPVLAGAGTLACLVWFRWKGRKEGQLPGALKALAAVLAGWTAGILVINWIWMHNLQGFAAAWGEVPLTWFGVPIGPNGGTMVSRSVDMLENFLQYGGMAAAFAGVYALVKARTGDRRWAAVYVLAMTVMLVSMETLALLISMSISAEASWENDFASYFYIWTALAAAGMVGTGVALC